MAKRASKNRVPTPIRKAALERKLNRAEMMGFRALQMHVVSLQRQVAQAQQELNAALVELGLDPAIKYDIDGEGMVYLSASPVDEAAEEDSS